MIGFNNIGKLGLLGNQMFQYSALKGIAINNGYDYCIPPYTGSRKWEDNLLYIPFTLSKLNRENLRFISDDYPTIQENSFSFDEILFKNCPDNVNIHGYFQTEKYFIDIRDDILSDFTFKTDIVDSCKEFISDLNNPISLHIRRGDYLTNPNHYSLNLKYYERALEYFDKDRTVIVFSDDPEWCNKQELFSEDRFLISDDNPNYIDLCLMTLCKSNIIANSSFSWWGAWLSNYDNMVIAPKDWFGNSNNKHLNTKDIIPERWIKI